MTLGVQLVEFYRQHPVIAAEDLLNVKLAVPQARALEDMWFKNYVAITAGRGAGKTYISGVFACLQAMLYPGQKVGLLAPSFRQAKMLFAEVEKIWNTSDILREATSSKPIKASDRCYLTFKQAGNRPPSLIEAIPLGDGSLIRGARYYIIIADEFAQLPEEIFNQVILPMGATAPNPMERVKRVAMRKKIEARGGDTSLLEEETTNKVIMTSSAYYQFNHMYQRIKVYRDKIEAGDKGYAVHTIPYYAMPDGFLEKNNLKEAQATLSRDQFRMEYEAEWISDSSGIFKASLIQSCTTNSNFTVQKRGLNDKQYVLGVDPARTRDAFAIVVIELGRPNKVVAAYEYYRSDFPTIAKIVMDLSENFNVVRILMDQGGGGLAVKDLLEEEARWQTRRILDLDDEKNLHKEGRKILQMMNFSPKTIAEANYNTLNLMEKNALAFPKGPQFFNVPSGDLEELEDIYDTVKKMVEQVLSIEVRENASGGAKFDLPEGAGGGHAKQKKDLYTAFILAGKVAYDLNMPTEEAGYQMASGLIEPWNTGRKSGEEKLSGTMGVAPVPMGSWAFRRF